MQVMEKWPNIHRNDKLYCLGHELCMANCCRGGGIPCLPTWK